MKGRPISRKVKDQGMNWIRQEKRLAIYLRDGLACAYCGTHVEGGARLTLDHVVPYCKGGSNQAGNLVTACLSCNSSRGDRPVRKFAAHVAAYLGHGVTAKEIVRHIDRTRARVLPMDQARELIARRGSAARVLADL